MESTLNRPEYTYSIILNYHRIHFGMHLVVKDISVCHRQTIPSEKKKQGKNYIPPIYCKFLNRSVALHILQSWKRCLRNERNVYGQPLEVRHNLTPANRILWDDIQSKLVSYKYKFISNWKIFVKKERNSRPATLLQTKCLTKPRLPVNWYPLTLLSRHRLPVNRYSLITLLLQHHVKTRKLVSTLEKVHLCILM